MNKGLLMGLCCLTYGFGYTARGQGCNAVASQYKITDAEKGYASRTKTRCEGFFLPPVGAASLDLMAVTLGPTEYTLQPQEELYISLPAQIKAQAHLTALSFGTRPRYRLDDTLRAQDRITISVKRDLSYKTVAIQQQDLGLYAQAWFNGKWAYLPVVTSSKQTGEAKEADMVSVQLFPSGAADSVRYKIVPEGGLVQVAKLAGSFFPAREPIMFQVPRALAGKGAGKLMPVLLSVQLKPAGSGHWTVYTDYPILVPATF